MGVKRVGHLLQHAAEQRLHVIGVNRVEHDAQRSREAAVCEGELVEQAVVVSLGGEQGVRGAHDEQVGLPRRAHAVAARGHGCRPARGKPTRQLGERAIRGQQRDVGPGV